jgi:hypothetical protein
MKQYYLTTSPSGIGLIPKEKMPVKPTFSSMEMMSPATQPDCNKKIAEYEVALQRAISEAVPVADQEKAKQIILKPGNFHSPNIYGPFSLRYEIESKCGKFGFNTVICGKCFSDGNGCQEPVKVAILYDDTPERPGLREALREVKANNKELRDSYNDPIRLDFRIKDSRGFPTGEVIEEAKVTPEKEESQDPPPP